MKTGFYSKIAAGNIKNNARLYIPRILAEAGLLGCFYILFRFCPKFCVNSKSQCKIEQKLLFWGVSPLSTL